MKTPSLNISVGGAEKRLQNLQKVRDYLAQIGSKGGKAGTGEAKRRPKAVCVRAGKLGAKARWNKNKKGK